MTNNPNTKQNQQALTFGLGLAFFVVVLMSLVSGGWWLVQKLIAQETSPVSSVVISGEMPYTQKQEVLNAISAIDLGNFFQVSVNDIQAEVSVLPWVYSVAVRKQWPDEVKIYIVDQTPVALWNGDFLLNQFGKAFQADINQVKHAVPHFYGPEGSEILALENYANFSSLLNYSALSIDELVLSERFSWQLTLSDGVMLNLGREERVERIQRFIDLYPLIKSHGSKKVKKKNNSNKLLKQAVDYIDLRYDTGLAVGWKSVAKLSSIKWQKINKILNCGEKLSLAMLSTIEEGLALNA
ncbi:MAG: cell division protein FtsQ/DivIB [Litorilituus sp.]|jgi:cell division protein FtsQ|nr:cell division protein FtsQ/DivIB [Litorilituus sp.]